jgi:hypothetical protein
MPPRRNPLLRPSRSVAEALFGGTGVPPVRNGPALTNRRHACAPKLDRITLLCCLAASTLAAHARQPIITTAPAPAVAQRPAPRDPAPIFTLIDAQLATRDVRLIERRATGFVVQDSTGRRTISTDSVIAFVNKAPALSAAAKLFSADAPSPAAAWLTLTDGRRVHGLITEPAAPDSLTLRHNTLGDLTFPLELAARLDFANAGVISAADVRPDPSPQDQVFLRNGDRVQGFVESIASTIVIDRDGTTITPELVRVVAVVFANPSTPPVGTSIWLSDGTILHADDYKLRAPELELTLPANSPASGSDRAPEPESAENSPPASKPAFSVDLRQLAAIAPKAERFTPLARLAITKQSGAQGRRWSAPVKIAAAGPLGLADIELPGPMSVEWSLPQDADRLSFEILLPPESRIWGDCVVVVEFIRDNAVREIARHRLNATTPAASINSETREASTLRIRVEQGEGGPIQDRIHLRRGILLRSTTLLP